MEHGHKHMKDIIDGDHETSVKHRGEEGVKGVGGLAPDMADGYEEASRTEAFKGGGKLSGTHLHHAHHTSLHHAKGGGCK